MNTGIRSNSTGTNSTGTAHQKGHNRRHKGRALLLMVPLIPLMASCQQATTQSPLEASEEQGTLLVVANGEAFVREGFTDKDGWQISFDHVYTTLDDVVVSQAQVPFEAESGEPLEAAHQISSAKPVTVDLAAEQPDAPLAVVTQFDGAKSGRYNALAWTLSPAETGPAAGYSILMIGEATKAGETIPFEMGIEEAIAFNCGDFVGDTRKGILAGGETAEVEATFHFDHVFGDGEAAADDEINQGALGFEPLAAIAENNELVADSKTLKAQLSEAEYETLKTVLLSLGHVGEGHCSATDLSAADPSTTESSS
ncbi:MAG: DUF4382 domain-containing protein [Cyanobacteria bacterium J06614_10]